MNLGPLITEVITQMPVQTKNTNIIKPSYLAELLKALRRIGDLEIRQAQFFSSRFPDENLRDDFQILLLLLLACLYKGYPSARGKEMIECVEGVSGSENIPGLSSMAQDHSSLSGEIKNWFSRITDENVINSMTPLVACSLNPDDNCQPLVIYDKTRKAFSFQAYYISTNMLSAAIPEMLKAEKTGLDIKKARAVLSNSLKVAFAGRSAHVRQVLAGIISLMHRFTVISGGPGTGKSTVVHLVIRAVCEYYDIPPSAVILCAPTGRAKARLLEAVTRNLSQDDPFVSVQARTLHSLLRIGRDGKPLYNKENRLPCGLVVVDEVSMVDMRLFAQLIDALSPDCRLILAGDMDQLPPVDAGAVLGDLTSRLAANSGQASISKESLSLAEKILSGLDQVESVDELYSAQADKENMMVDHAVFLTRNYRSDKGIMEWWEGYLSGKVKKDSSSVEYLSGTDLENRFMEWTERYMDEVYKPWKESLRPLLLDKNAGNGMSLAADLRKLIGVRRLLCCVNDGSYGRNRANSDCDAIFRRLKGMTGRIYRWHDGQPVIVNRNQENLGLYNGDLGIVLEDDEGLWGCFPVQDGVLRVPVERISDLDQAYAISVHKSQGSEFDEIMLLVPENSSMPVSRQLIYTAITRAKHRVCIVDPGKLISNENLLPVEERYSLLSEIL